MFIVTLFRHLIHHVLLLSSYVMFMAVIPLFAFTIQVKTQLLPRLSYHLGLSLVYLDPHLLSVALVTFFIYFFFHFINDTIYSIQSLYAEYTGRTFVYNNTATTTSNIQPLQRAYYPNPNVAARSSNVMSPWTISVALFQAHDQAVQYYPAFVLSTVLAWAHTNQLDIYSITFVIIQIFLLLLLPITYACPGNLICHLNRVAYQCALLWTVIYALCPQVTGYAMNRFADDYLFRAPPNYYRIF